MNRVFLKYHLNLLYLMFLKNPKYHLNLLNHLSPHFLQNLKYHLNRWPLMLPRFRLNLRFLKSLMYLKNLKSLMSL
jgi:hypothetical protein